MSVCVINPLYDSGWDSLLQTSDQATFFHTSAWAKGLNESYGYTPQYFTAIEGHRLSGLIAVMDIKSLLTGRRGVSLPFSDECNPVAKDQRTFELLLNELIAFGQRVGWKYIEIRGGRGFLPNASCSAKYYVHSLELASDENRVSRGFKSNIRRNIKRSEKESVKVTIGYSQDAVAAFYQMHCGTRRLHGLPPQPWSFFSKIYKHIIAAGKGFVALARYRSRWIAGAMFVLYRDQATYKYGASDRNYQSLRANNLVMWEAIRWCCRNGIRSLHFGRTESWNKGLLQFKRAWGALENQLEYHTFALKAGIFIKEKSRIWKFPIVFRIMPMSLLRLTGNLLYRHVG